MTMTVKVGQRFVFRRNAEGGFLPRLRVYFDDGEVCTCIETGEQLFIFSNVNGCKQTVHIRDIPFYFKNSLKVDNSLMV